MTEREAKILRSLAPRVAEIASLPEQAERAERWRRLNDLEPVRPLVITRMWPYCWQEVLPDESVLETTDPTAREYERRLRHRIWEWENLPDDRVVEPTIYYPQVCRWEGWFGPRREFPDDRSGGAYRPVPVIVEKRDIEKITVPQLIFDAEATKRHRALAEELFGGILAVRAEPPPWTGNSVGDAWCEMRGMAQAFIAVSPDMHEEFMFRYERRALDHFGLNCIVCCETIDNKLEGFRSIPHLRKAAVSEWNDLEVAAEGLARDFVFSYRPSGVALGDPIWNPDAVRAELREVLAKSRGCVVEIVNNIGGSCRGEPERLRQWTAIAMELVREYEQ